MDHTRVLEAYRAPLELMILNDIRTIVYDMMNQDFTYGPADTKFLLVVEYLKRLDRALVTSGLTP